MNGRIGLVDRGRAAGVNARRANGNGNGRMMPVVTNAERERARTIPAVQDAFNIAARKENRFGDDVSDLKTMLDEPLWSRFEITADETEDFVISLVLYGYKSQDMVG